MDPQANVRARWLIAIGAIGLLLLMPFVFMGVANGWSGAGFLAPGILIAGLLVALGLAGAPRSQDTVAGLPAPLHARPFGMPAGVAWRAFVASLPDRRRRFHRMLLWTPIVCLATATLLVMAAIVVGPRGAGAAPNGLRVVLGGVALLATYPVIAYRPLVPTAAAIGWAGVLLQIQGVASAWGLTDGWRTAALLLLLVLPLAQALAASIDRAFWITWAAVGTTMGAVYPTWLALGAAGAGGLPVGLTLASLVWGIAAVFAVAPVTMPVRRMGVVVMAAWSGAIVLAFAWPAEWTARVQAAGLVAGAAMGVVAFVAFLVRPAPSSAPEGTP